MESVEVLGVRDVNQDPDLPKSKPSRHAASINTQPAAPAPAQTHPQRHHQQKKKKDKMSSLCKTPPSTLRNNGFNYKRGDCLGEGGFARCFQVKSNQGKIYAAKTIAKESLTSEKTRGKLLTEIAIQRELKHTHIVEFIDCFEDNQNVYILLEMCSNQSLYNMLKTRGTLSNPETKLYMMQLLAGLQYMHSNNVIHRDLKLGNIFLDANMNLKIGDFGLAGKLKNSRERRFTVCGTPNYIAPEVLFKNQDGHSFHVDIWAVGVILYAMVYGKPPFQCKDIKMIYEKIKHLDYLFPNHDDKYAEDLVQRILQTNPLERFTIDQIIRHAFFRRTEPFPDEIPTIALTKTPDFSHLTPEQSLSNYNHLKQQVVNAAKTRNGSSAVGNSSNGSDGSSQPATTNGVSHNGAEAIVQIDTQTIRSNDLMKDGKHVLPESISPASTKEKYKMVMIPKKKVSGLREKLNQSEESNSEKTTDATTKHRIRSSQHARQYPDLPEMSTSLLEKNCARIQETVNAINNQRYLAKTESVLPLADLPDDVKYPVFVAKWIDFSQSAGFTYQLTNGLVGNLSYHGSTISYDTNTNKFWKYSGYDMDPSDFVGKQLTDKDIAGEYHEGVKVLKNNYRYMKKHLCQSDNCTVFNERAPVFIRRHIRQDMFVLFELTNGSFQFNFPDHVKLIISGDGLFLNVIDEARNMTCWSLAHAFRLSRPRSTDDEEFIRSGRLLRELKIGSKLDYCEQKLNRLCLRDSETPRTG